MWRLWQELASDYPSFEFKHGHGLGVLGVGKEIPLPLRPLFFGSEASRERIRQIYARLGMTVAERLDLSSAREAIALRDNELGMLRSEVKARAEAFLALEAETDRLRSDPFGKAGASRKRVQRTASGDWEQDRRDREFADSTRQQRQIGC